MCGIVGYVGAKNACEIVVRGLERLEYRGYDSAGVAVCEKGAFRTVKTVGKVAKLKELVGAGGLSGNIGIGHTRWATHGGVTTANAHPHTDEKHTVVLVHNGIIENYKELRDELVARNVHFSSETDTEVAAQLLARLYDGEPVKALCRLFKKCRGAFAFVLVFGDRPDELYCVRKGAPLVVALGDGEAYCASDVPAIVEHADKVIFLNEGEICRLSASGAEFWDLDGVAHQRRTVSVEVDAAMIDKAGYPHFMLKEINEQGSVLRRALFGRTASDLIDLGGEWGIAPEKAKTFKRMDLVACGTSFYAATVAQRVLEKYLKIDIRVDIASEYRYRPLRADGDTMAVFVSQSGETLDTLEALRHVKGAGAYTVAVTNAPNSSIAREVDDVIRLNAGIEIGTGKKTTFQLFGTLNPWKFSGDKKMRFWNVMPEYRWYTCQKFGGHFFGIHALGGEYNIKNIDMPFGILPKTLEGRHYEGWYVGGGLTYGYQWLLNKHLNFEGSIGLGYAYSPYKLYGRCEKCLDKDHRNYVGPTKAALSLIYVF